MKSDNYRAICLTSSICKLFDALVIEREYDKLLTSDLQFAYKKGHSTDLNIMILKDTVSYYLSNDTPVYCCMIDASKAFDRLNIIKIVNILLQRNINPSVMI